MKNDIIKKLEQYMIDNKLTQYELARKLGTTESNISRWLSGKVKMGRAWRELIKIKLNT